MVSFFSLFMGCDRDWLRRWASPTMITTTSATMCRYGATAAEPKKRERQSNAVQWYNIESCVRRVGDRRKNKKNKRLDSRGGGSGGDGGTVKQSRPPAHRTGRQNSFGQHTHAYTHTRGGRARARAFRRRHYARSLITVRMPDRRWIFTGFHPRLVRP